MGAGGSKLTPETVSDLQNSTQFDKREIAAWYRSFLDECPSGVITRDQMRQLFRSFFPFGDPTKFADLIFRLFTEPTTTIGGGHDGHGNGGGQNNNDGPLTNTINYPQYLRGLSVASRGRTEDKIKWSFRFYDVDGDGLVSRADLLFVLQAATEMVAGMVEVGDAGGRVAAIFDAVRPKDSERIAYEEFAKAFQEDPDLLQGLIIYDGLV